MWLLREEAPSSGQVWTTVSNPASCMESLRLLLDCRIKTQRAPRAGLSPVYFPSGSRQAGLLTVSCCHLSLQVRSYGWVPPRVSSRRDVPSPKGPKSRALQAPRGMTEFISWVRNNQLYNPGSDINLCFLQPGYGAERVALSSQSACIFWGWSECLCFHEAMRKECEY